MQDGSADMDLNTAWSAGLTMATTIIGFLLKEKFSELTRLNLLLNKTREEIARDYITNAEVQRITDHIDQRLTSLKQKLTSLFKRGSDASDKR